jgi:hypothetical protein
VQELGELRRENKRIREDEEKEGMERNLEAIRHQE